MENSKDKEIGKSDSRRINVGSDELVEILTWLPAKQVIKFSSLSKTIYSLLSTPEFAKTQCIRSSAIASGGVFLQECTSRHPLKLEFYALPEDRVLSSSTGIPNESLSYLVRADCHILSSSQGLLLLHMSVDLYVCNPATRRLARLAIPPWLKSRPRRNYHYPPPLLECHPRNLNYRYNNWADDYTVVIPLLEDDNAAVNIAVYSDGKWEEVRCDLPTVSDGQRLLMVDSPPVCLFNGRNGGLVVHYLCERRTDDLTRTVGGHIVAYDVGRKAFSRNFKLPEECNFYIRVLRLFKWRSSSSSCETIAFVRRQPNCEGGNTFTVWALEDYEGGSWTRMFQKTTGEMGVMEKQIVWSFILVMNATGMGLVFAVSDRVYAYQLDGPQSGRLQLVAERGYRAVEDPYMNLHRLKFIHHINTLRPVCGGETQLVRF